MRPLGKTIKNLRAHQGAFAQHRQLAPSERLCPLRGFGYNPGNLLAWHYCPNDLQETAPLVVVLHGCSQSAASYDHGSQWTELADASGFAVLFPEQTRANNMNLCFNWFEAGDNRRGRSEPLSIYQMVRAMVERFGLDDRKVFITGLSAGGAMTSIMLALYPETFTAGAIIAGLPFGTATGVPQALERMRGQGGPKDVALANLIPRRSSTNSWPAVSVWHGSADHTVNISNARDIVDQWRGVHGVGEQSDFADLIDGHPHKAWRGKDGRVVVEEFIINGMGHGTPLDSRIKVGGGNPGAHMLDVGVSSTNHLARLWGIASLEAHTKVKARPAIANIRRRDRTDATQNRAVPKAVSPQSFISDVIEDALRRRD